MIRNKKQTTKRLTALLMVIALAASLPACSKSSGGGSASGTASGTNTNIDKSNINPAGTKPILKEKVKLTLAIPQDTNITDRNTNDYTKKLEEGVNVDLEFIDLPSSGAEQKQKLSVMISSDSELPDMICMGLSDLEVYTYGSQGYFIDMTDYMNSISVNAKPYLESEDAKQYLPYIYSADGKMYSFPRIIEDLGNNYDHRMWINQTWLTKLGLSMPKTTDEYYNVLKAFKDKDPNGNGVADELPLIGDKDGWNQSVWKTLMGSFVQANDNYGYLMKDSSGKLAVSYTQPGWKKGLEYMNKLNNDGLLSPLTFTQDQNQYKQIIENADVQLVGATTAGSMSVYQVASKRKEDMASMAPLTGPDGVCTTAYRASGLPTYFGYITKDCKHPEAAFMVFDYMWDRDMALQARFGVKDVDWKAPDTGAIGMYESLGYKPMVQYINSIWGTVQNSQWGENHPTLRTYDMICGQVWNGNKFDSQYMTAQAVPKYKDLVVKDPVLQILYLPEEADEISEIKATLDTYRDEAAVAFITGNRPLSDWDNYLKELDTIGLKKYMEVTQTAYDRMMANAK